ncbi:MAG TPA: RHS repeat-associated core domain-containing protein [Actinocrinis sp.]|uniref:RHS repeat-associated core domain-containing protein n=1 Tax=Actinocrinis sp. TaxID=1920516 RepID=UPI002DDCF0E1|nr:RHS repeat-associated core domain-containing protein [Actinocrinis sp.]HEV3172904.1 RHS repeat-associated core domain-containing protein [Actinocrinis sp.]
MRIGVDYGGFAGAFGGSYATRLSMVTLPACALTTPQVPACRVETPLVSTNNAADKSVSAVVALPAATAAVSNGNHADTAETAAPVVLAATAGTISTVGGGTYAATSLKPSGSWTAGGSSGSFTYSYPISVPPAASKLVPSVALSYDSGSVDGQTASTQAQSSWIGDGWSGPESYIEQSFIPCADSPEGSAAPSSTPDQCYDGAVLSLSLNGSTTPLVVLNTTAHTYRPAQDNGETVIYTVTKTGSNGNGNGAGTNDDGYWRVIERDGTEFDFGRNELPGWTSGKPATNSVDSEPVYSAHSTDPCYNPAGFTASVCTMAYRWNLDYVTDTHHNAMAYYYRQDTNYYGQNNGAANVSYVRDSHLDHIDYGFTDGNAYGAVPDRIKFTPGERCFTTCDPISSNSANWQDVPYDLNCAAKAACQVTSPSFWSTVSLSGITTLQNNGSGWTTVDSYTFKQIYPPTGDDTAPTLWLSSIQRQGEDTSAGGAAVPVPAVTFDYVAEANRVNTATDGLAALYRMRIKTVTTETGSQIGVAYALTNPCTAPVTLDPAANTSSCFPVNWTPPNSGQLTDWFNKYVVHSVTQTDPSGGSAGLYTEYKYPAGPAWHYDDNEVVQEKYRTYGQYRGYGDVLTYAGQSSDPVTQQETTYYRGMSDDDNTTAVTLKDSQNGSHDDTNQLAGDTLESTSYNYKGGPITGSTITSYWVSAPTLSRSRTGTGLPDLTANATGPVESWTRTALTDGGTTTWRKTETDTAYDTDPNSPTSTFGLPTVVYQHGDLALTGNNQQRCTTTGYAAPNTGLNLAGLPAEVETDADPCGGANPGGASAPSATQINALTPPGGVNRPADVVSDVRTFYDLQPLGSTSEPSTAPIWPQAAPVYGDVSEAQIANGYTGGAFTYQVKSAGTYDSYGRALDTWDGLGRETKNATTTTNGITTAVATTNPLGQTSTATLDPYRGLPVSTTDVNGVTSQLQYDGIGRTTAVWKYSRPTSAPANDLYSYAYGTKTTPTVVTTQVLNDESQYATSTTLFDALLRTRQTQTPTPQGGRLISDAFYDTHGLVVKTNTDYWDPKNAPDGTLMQVADNLVDQQTLTAYDGLGRAVEVQSEDNRVSPTVDQITYAQYTGDKTITVPPTGGTATATVTDALGRTTELDQYTAAPTVSAGTSNAITTVTITGGTTQATDYVFDNVGQQTDVKDATTGADWNTSYDLLGQAVASNDPDAGATTGITYDFAGNLTQSTDARGKTLSYTYDALNRKTGQYDAPVASQSSANQLASWVYDNSNNATVNGALLTDPIGHLTTETAYVNGNAYTTQSAGFNVFGESLGQTITIPSSEGALAGSYTYSQTYTPTTGLPRDMTYPAAGNLDAETVVTGYSTYYNLDVVTGLASLTGYTQNVTYTDLGQVGQEVIGSSSVNAALTNTFDPHTGALTDQQIANTTVSATPIDDTKYRYDLAGNPTSQTETRNGTQAETQCYQYDKLDRLTQAWTATDQCAATPTGTSHTTVGDGITGGAYWTTWQYNSDGTRKSETDHSLASGTGDTTTNYTYGGTAPGCPSAGGTHTLQTAAVTGPSGTTTNNTYCYDQTGNTTQRNTSAQGQQSLTWNDLGQLTALTTASAGSSYIYDADGNLLLQKDPGTTTLYLPGQQVALNTSTSTTTTTRFYALPGGAQAVRTGTGSNYSFELTDQHNTSTLTLSSTLTSPVWRQQTPYGAPRGTAPTTWPDNHGFLNKPQDPTTGLTDVGARWYDPATGTFTSLDPVLETASPQQLNGYSYAADNPVTGSDPTGLMACGESGPCGGNPNQGFEGPSGNPCPGPDSCPTSSSQPPSNGGSGSGSYAVVGGGVVVDTSNPHFQELANWGEGIAFNSSHASASVNVQHQEALRSWLGLCTAHPDVCGKSLLALLAAQVNAIGSADDWRQTTDPLLVTASGAATVLSGVDTSAGDAAAAAVYEKKIGLDNGVAAILQLAIGNAFEGALSSALGRLGADPEPGGFASCATNSFTGATPILMADGASKPIDQVKVGDRIANNLPGADPGTKDQTHTVTAVHVTYTDRDYTDVTIATPTGPATITGTAHHPYWDQTTHAWTDADQLHPGDHLQTSDGNTVTVATLRDYTATTVTYNLTIDDLHSYYVVAGDTPVLVHNDPGGWTITPQRSTAVMRGGPFGAMYYQQPPDSTDTVYWWSPDQAGHGGSAWKVYTENSTGLQWYADADANGKFITGKWKGATGMSVPFKNLKSVNMKGIGSCL